MVSNDNDNGNKMKMTMMINDEMMIKCHNGKVKRRWGVGVKIMTMILWSGRRAYRRVTRVYDLLKLELQFIIDYPNYYTTIYGVSAFFHVPSVVSRFAYLTAFYILITLFSPLSLFFYFSAPIWFLLSIFQLKRKIRNATNRINRRC